MNELKYEKYFSNGNLDKYKLFIINTIPNIKKKDSNICAVADGEVVISAYDAFGYGNYVKIKHVSDDGNIFYTLYAHMQTIMAVQGSEVKAGDLIGYVGSTGNSTGAHCHFEIQTGSGTYTGMRKDPDAPDPALAALGVP